MVDTAVATEVLEKRRPKCLAELLNCLEKHVHLLEDLEAYEVLGRLQPVASRPSALEAGVGRGFPSHCLRWVLGGLLLSAPHLNTSTPAKNAPGTCGPACG